MHTALTLFSFAQIVSVFPNLKSLKIDNVRLENRQRWNWKEISRNLKSLEMLDYSRFTDFRLKQLIKEVNQIKVLKVKYIHFSKIRHLANLEVLESELKNANELQEILKNHPKLTKIV